MNGGWDLRISEIEGSFGQEYSPAPWVEGGNYATIKVDTVGDMIDALHTIPLEAFLRGKTNEHKIGLTLFRTPCCSELGIEITDYLEGDHANKRARPEGNSQLNN